MDVDHRGCSLPLDPYCSLPLPPPLSVWFLSLSLSPSPSPSSFPFFPSFLNPPFLLIATLVAPQKVWLYYDEVEGGNLSRISSLPFLLSLPFLSSYLLASPSSILIKEGLSDAQLGFATNSTLFDQVSIPIQIRGFTLSLLFFSLPFQCFP